MSAIHNTPPNQNAVIRRYHTKIKVIVHSHIVQDPLNLSDDVTNINIGKNLKGTGQANIALSPAMNYLNYIGPNDYVNVYINRSDGQSWTRVFFGLIDRIEESYSVNERGAPVTTYSLLCSDFAKVFDKSQYYTNPAIVNRDDVFTREIGNPYATVNLYSNGLQIEGCPSDVVTQIAIGFIGFSGQFGLPDSYAISVGNSTLVGENRALRMNLAASLMRPEAAGNLPNGGLLGIAQSAAERGDIAAATLAAERGSTGTVDLDAVAREFGVNVRSLPTNLRDNPYAVREFVASQHVKNSLLSIPGFTNGQDLFGSRESSITNIVTSGLPGTPRNLLSLVNLGTFVERRAIDGYICGAGVPNQDSSIINLLRQWSNEMVNELFFDLRPMSATNDGLAIGTNWSTDPDEIGQNEGGVRYVPAMVMREYPFSTINKLDASEVEYALNTRTGQPATFDEFHFGAIFSDGPNSPGRHIIEIPSINITDRILKKSAVKYDIAKKHIDVATIHSSEIIRSTFSRSDTDVVNLIELTTEGAPGMAANQYMVNLLPVITPIHIRRHGLRIKSDSTRFARLSLDLNEDPGTTAAEEQPASTTAPTPAPSGTLHAPMVVGPGQNNRSYVMGSSPTSGIRWGYVRKEGSPLMGRVHHGVDIFAKSGQPVHAVMDGTVVWMAENGSGRRNNVYGNCIVIHHPGMGIDGEDLWTVYAHLGQPLHSANGHRNPRYDESNPAMSTGFNPQIRQGSTVRAGDIIGYCGWSAGDKRKADSQGKPWIRYSGIRQGNNSGDISVHLHFEILRNRTGSALPVHGPFPAANSSTNNKVTLLQPGNQWPDGLPPRPGYTQESLDHLSSIDPVKFFLDKSNINLISSCDLTGSSSVDEDDIDHTDDEPDPDDIDSTPPVRDDSTPQNDAPTPNSGIGSNLDGGLVQKLVGRWALLQDHWYQHNPEYLSGTIDMRGAPEIRVGYRLDIIDRNLSFYVEGVSHKWQYPGAMVTSINITRGQPNNPYPAYILPRTNGFSAGPAQRDIGSRLGMFFLAPDPLSIRKSLVIRKKMVTSPMFSETTNSIDTHDFLSRNTNENFMVAATETSPQTAMENEDGSPGAPDLMGTDLLNRDESPLEDQAPAIFGTNPGGIRNV